MTSSQYLPLDLKPGETRTVVLNGPGRVIVGKVTPQGGSAATLEMRYSLNYLVRHNSSITPPPQLSDPRWKSIPGWDDSFALTPEGRTAMACRETFFVKLNPDGTFRAEGLAAGRYDLRVQLYGDPKGGCLTSPVAGRTITIDVTGPEGTTIDMGNVEVEVERIPTVGDDAPELQYTDEQGTRHSLSELSGKIVVLDFWATWCGPCMAEMPAVRKLHDDVAGRGVVVLGLSLDSDAEVLWRAVKSRGMTWPQGWAGDFSQSPAAKAYGISAVPMFVVIGQDGKIMARESNAAAARAVIEKVLGSNR